MNSITRSLNIVATLTKNRDRKQMFLSIKLYIRLTHARSHFHFASHSICINCHNYWLAICFKHLRNVFPWLETTDTLLLGLWKAFYFTSKNRYILNEIQAAYSVNTLTIFKAAITRWLSHGATCKRCQERYIVIIESLGEVSSKDPKAVLIGVRSQLMWADTLLQICFLEDILTITNILSLVLLRTCSHKSANLIAIVCLSHS